MSSFPSLAFLSHEYQLSRYTNQTTSLQSSQASPFDVNDNIPATQSCVTGFIRRTSTSSSIQSEQRMLPSLPRNSLIPWLLTNDEFILSSYEMMLFAFDTIKPSNLADNEIRRQAENALRSQLDITTQTHNSLLQSMEGARSSISSNDSYSSRSHHMYWSFVNARIDLCRSSRWQVFETTTNWQSFMKRQLRLIASSIIWTCDNLYEHERLAIQRDVEHYVEHVERTKAAARLDSICHRLTCWLYDCLLGLHGAARSLSKFSSNNMSRASEDPTLNSSLDQIASLIQQVPIRAAQPTDPDHVLIDSSKILLRPPRQLTGSLYERIIAACSSGDDLHSNHTAILLSAKVIRSVFATSPVSHAIGLIRCVKSSMAVALQSEPNTSILEFPCLKRSHAITAMLQTAVHILSRQPELHSSLDQSDKSFILSFVNEIVLPALSHACEGPAAAAGLLTHVAIELSHLTSGTDRVTIARSVLDSLIKSAEQQYLQQRPHLASLMGANEVKPVSEWSSSDWREVGLATCEVLTLGADYLAKECSDIDFGIVPAVDLAEDIAVAIIKLFSSDVSQFLNARTSNSKTGSGLDEASMAVVGAVCTVRNHVIALEDIIFPGSRAKLISLLPNVAALSDTLMQRWIQNQTTKLKTSILPRITQVKTLEAFEDSKHSQSVVDFFSVLSTLVTAFFDHLARFAPYAAHRTVDFYAALDSAITEFGDHFVARCGTSARVKPVGGDSFKLKQSLPPQSAVPRVALFNKGKSSQEKAESEIENASLIDRNDPKSIASQNMKSFCLIISSIQASIDALSELRGQCEQSLSQLIRRYPIIDPSHAASLSVLEVGPKPASGIELHAPQSEPWAISDDEVENESLEDDANLAGLDVVPGISLRRWTHWGLALPTSAPLFSGVPFDSAGAALSNDITRASALFGDYLAFVEWRTLFISNLYSPSVRAGPHVQNGEIHAIINSTMPTIYKSVDEAVFPVISQQILRSLCEALTFVLIYGRRCCEPEDSVVLQQDLDYLESLFGREANVAQLLNITASYRALIKLIAQPTDSLINQFDSGIRPNSPFDLSTLARVVGLRQGKVVEKFMKREREKQKKRQADRTSPGTPRTQ